MDRTAQEREDHILDCYETIKQRDAEIERLRGLADYWHRMHDAVHDEKEHLRAALHDARQGLNLGLLADGLNGEIKNRLRTSWLKVGDALNLEPGYKK